ncbi:MAG: tetratricopeptide repeat protein [Chitinispirillia bacterium]|nr:tetratricopeptide repeat protein [Chitinispirillia bacterium]
MQNVLYTRLFHTLVCIILGAALIAPVCADEVRKLNRRANKLYSQGKYDEALKLYEEAMLLDPQDNKLRMNRGSALYRLGEMDEAESSYIGSLSQTDKKTLADAHYNLGNILYRQGEHLKRDGDFSTARSKYSQALENYVETLKLRPNDKDAKWNLQLAHRNVEMLENTQCENPQNSDNDDKGDDGDQQQNQQQNNKNDEQDKNDKDDKNQQEQQQDENKNEQQNEQRTQEEREQDLKREEAERLIELYADDADTLSKPKQNKRVKQPEKDW